MTHSHLNAVGIRSANRTGARDALRLGLPSVCVLLVLVVLSACGQSMLIQPASTTPKGSEPLDAPPGSVAQAPWAPAAADLPWPARMELQSGLSPATLAGLARAGSGQPWKPMGAILPLAVPVQSLRLVASPGSTARKKVEQDLHSRILPPLRAERGLAEGVAVLGEGSGAFVVRPSDPAQRLDVPRPRAGRANLAFEFVSLRTPMIDPKTDQQQARLERTAFFYYDPAEGWQDDGTPINAIAPRGLVVVLPGMFGAPQEQITGLVKRLRQSGYAVLRMMAHPSRFTERMTFAVPLTGDLLGVAAEIAGELTDRAAECAYAVEAASAYVLQERPMLVGLPRAGLGMSGGAMVLPTVVARDPSAWNALIFIGGGVDYLRIFLTSNYTDWIDALKISWMRFPDPQPAPGQMGESATLRAKAPPERVAELLAAYCAAAPLDSANLTPRLQGIPTLLIHASTDRAVPAATGEEIWQSLGRPERWVVSGGHEWLFFTLGGRTSNIINWLDTALAPPSGVRIEGR